MSLERFEELANLPSTFPTSSEAGAIDIDGKFAVVVDDIMPEELLGRIIALAEEQEFSAALLNVGDGHQEKGVLNESSRKSQRSVIDSDSLAGRTGCKVSNISAARASESMTLRCDFLLLSFRTPFSWWPSPTFRRAALNSCSSANAIILPIAPRV